MSDRARYWQSLLAAWAESGLSQEEFCRRHGVKAVTFGWWRRRLANGTVGQEDARGQPVRRRRRDSASRGAGTHAAFIEVALPVATERTAVTRSTAVVTASCCYEVVLPQGGVVRVPSDSDPVQVLGLLRAVVLAC